jgi:hypothetical protein
MSRRVTEKNRRNALPIFDRLQLEGSDVARHARFLVESKAAEWKEIELAGGEKYLALCLPEKYWMLSGDSLVWRK